MKRTRAAQATKPPEHDGAHPTPKPQRRSSAAAAEKRLAAAGKPSKQPRAKKAAEKHLAGAGDAPATVPDAGPPAAAAAAGGGGEVGPAVEWDPDAGLLAGSWWSWGVEEEKLLGWFPFVEEDFLCLGGRVDSEVGFDDDIWRIHQIYEIPSSSAK